MLIIYGSAKWEIEKYAFIAEEKKISMKILKESHLKSFTKATTLYVNLIYFDKIWIKTIMRN